MCDVRLAMSLQDLMRCLEAWTAADSANGLRALACERGASLSDAAASSGFADQSHLSRHFLRQFGYTPGAWRKAIAPNSSVSMALQFRSRHSAGP